MTATRPDVERTPSEAMRWYHARALIDFAGLPGVADAYERRTRRRPLIPVEVYGERLGTAHNFRVSDNVLFCDIVLNDGQALDSVVVRFNDKRQPVSAAAVE